MSWIKDLIDPTARSWEDFYHNRWQHDAVVRSTHGVNCTGGCSWLVYVKNGILTCLFGLFLILLPFVAPRVARS